jgi:hypothetical protein
MPEDKPSIPNAPRYADALHEACNEARYIAAHQQISKVTNGNVEGLFWGHVAIFQRKALESVAHSISSAHGPWSERAANGVRELLVQGAAALLVAAAIVESLRKDPVRETSP